MTLFKDWSICMLQTSFWMQTIPEPNAQKSPWSLLSSLTLNTVDRSAIFAFVHNFHQTFRWKPPSSDTHDLWPPLKSPTSATEFSKHSMQRVYVSACIERAYCSNKTAKIYDKCAVWPVATTNGRDLTAKWHYTHSMCHMSTVKQNISWVFLIFWTQHRRTPNLHTHTHFPLLHYRRPLASNRKSVAILTRPQ